MPGTPKPVGQNGPFPPHWNAVLQAIQALQLQVNGLTAGSTQGNLVDGNGNTVEVAGTNLSQIVTIGASHGQAGVLVGTALTGAGRAVQGGLATTTIATTKGSTSATVASATGLAKNMVIGAANVSDPGSGVATPAITPGTTIAGISGTAVTLSQNAAESGATLYCAACYWIVVQPLGLVQQFTAANLKAQTGTTSVTWPGATGVSGTTSVSFPTAFPTSVQTLITSAALTSAGQVCEANWSSLTLSGFNVLAFDPAGSPANGVTASVSWIALGN